MPVDTSTDRPVRLLPMTMPGPAAPAVGERHGRGLCVGEDPDVFFPSRGDPGIWGGLDQQERRNLRRKWRRHQPKAATA